MKKFIVFMIGLISILVFSYGSVISEECNIVEDKLIKYFTTYQSSIAEDLGYYNLRNATPEKLRFINQWNFETTKRMLLLEFEYPKVDPLTLHVMLRHYFSLKNGK